MQDQLHIKNVDNLLEVKGRLSQLGDPLESMAIIDSLQRLGIDYHFKEEIEDILGSIYKQDDYSKGDLFKVALSFRLLRQAGHHVSSDIFYKFTDENGEFDMSLRADIKGLLSLYEASYLNTGEDMVLYNAKEYSTKHLISRIGELEPDVARSVRRTLKNPFHKMLSRYNSPYYINQCRGKFVDGTRLNQLAREDFNRVQIVHQKELMEIISWWNRVGLAEELSFIRDQPLKWYAWPTTVLPGSEFSKSRIELTKVIAFVYTIDDIFDVYGSLEELTLFTEAIRTWDLSAVETLPRYMRTCYITLYNITKDIAQATYEEHGLNPINYYKESWERLCNAFLKESKWFRSKQVPKADEYLTNAIVSTGLCMVLLHAYFLLGQGITEENTKFLHSYPNLLSCPATILRLYDDLGSAKDENQEGFDGSYVEYLMEEHPNYTIEIATGHVMKLISRSWESLNKECLAASHFAPNLVMACLNTTRMVEVMYSYDKNHNLPILEDYIRTMLFKSV